MALFTSDLFKRIALGFVLGAAMVGVANADAGAIESPAQAAVAPQAPQPSAEFVIG